MGSFLHSNSYKNRIGYRFSGQYYRGRDWKSYDPYYEPDSIRLYRPTPYGQVYESNYRENKRDFAIEKISSEARVDYLLKPDLMLIANGGINRSSGIEITSLGSAQAVDWTYYYGQVRMNWKDLFAQVYLNGSDAGGTYLLRTGQRVVDKSKFWSAQVQHYFQPGGRVSFTYGFDSFFTRPNTDYTLNGRNEDKDNISEFGAYIQSEITVSEKIRLTEAARIDSHSRLDGLIFSPRSAVSYEPNQGNNLRLTYNRAYSTPYNTNFYLDILQADDPFGIGAALEPSLGFNPGIDVRVQGVPENGFHWNVNSDGPQFRSTFAPLDPRGLDETDFIDFGDPVFTNVMWNVGREIVIDGFADILGAFGIPPATIDSLTGSMRAVSPPTVSNVENSLMIFNQNTSAFEPFNFADLRDIHSLKPTYSNTVELGYKGVISDLARIGIDIYYTDRENFISPLAIETPNVFLDRETLAIYLENEFGLALADSSNLEYAQILATLDDPNFGGNGNGTPIDELTNIFSFGAAQIPFGTVSPVEAYDPQDILVTFRNFGNVWLYGVDLSIEYAFRQDLIAGANYSYISKNIFRKSSALSDDILLNSPRNKAAIFIEYSHRNTGLGGRTRVRYVDAFDMYGPFIGSRVDAYIIADQDLVFFFSENTRLTLTVQNLFDNRHMEFVGAPELGRLAVLRLVHTF
jgi:iron complex outermembrane receptor protein